MLCVACLALLCCQSLCCCIWHELSPQSPRTFASHLRAAHAPAPITVSTLGVQACFVHCCADCRAFTESMPHLFDEATLIEKQRAAEAARRAEEVASKEAADAAAAEAAAAEAEAEEAGRKVCPAHSSVPKLKSLIDCEISGRPRRRGARGSGECRAANGISGLGRGCRSRSPEGWVKGVLRASCRTLLRLWPAG